MAEFIVNDPPDPLPCRALKHLLPRLAKSIDPSVVSTELLAEEIITESTWEEAKDERSGLSNYDRSLKLLEVLQRAVRAKSDAFRAFCSILRKESVTEGLADKLEDELRKLESQEVEHSGHSEAGTGNGNITVVPRGDATPCCPDSNDECGDNSKYTAFLDQKPQLLPISLIKYEVKSPTGQVERKRLKLLEEVSNSWKQMGQYLGISGAVLDGWEMEHTKNYDCASAVIQRFLNNGSPKYRCTWSGLIELVEDIGYSNVAADFKEALIHTECGSQNCSV